MFIVLFVGLCEKGGKLQALEISFYTNYIEIYSIQTIFPITYMYVGLQLCTVPQHFNHILIIHTFSAI